MENTTKQTEQTQNAYISGDTTFHGLVLRDPSRNEFDKGSSIYCYLIEEGAYCWIFLNQVDHAKSKLKSPWNGLRLDKIWVTNYALRNIEYKRSWCPELYFSHYISYHQLEKSLLRRKLTKFIEYEKSQRKQSVKPKTFTLKNIKTFFGMPKIKSTDFCLSCRVDLLDKKKLICETCREFLGEDIRLSGVNTNAKYLPQGLMKDPLEIRFEDIGIKYKNRRYKWFESYKKGKVVKSKAKNSGPASKMKIIEDKVHEKSKTKKKTRKSKTRSKNKSKVKVI